jgi:hypothetical protein
VEGFNSQLNESPLSGWAAMINLPSFLEQIQSENGIHILPEKVFSPFVVLAIRFSH